MWRANEQDCLFVEMSRNVAANPHVIIEAIPVPVEIGSVAPIYFKHCGATMMIKSYSELSCNEYMWNSHTNRNGQSGSRCLFRDHLKVTHRIGMCASPLR
ncbi:hypothetical protein NECAME_02483 [Necator americanus]|uniref:Cwf19-like C-terminal domain-containing protein n=1 Tax=Necator americanus TaxID=51031 RepID=W2TEI8_NECAM|nr:hypothetical protein NECAME_02483 [Necator americanus]ETN80004.1 hypothetical protein NECAME_02483 [Necator americanus]